MPRQTVIENLENLFATYNQRRRATDALLRGLKGAHNALTKADRALTDYLDQDSTLDPAQLGQTQQTMASIQFKDRVYDVVQNDLRRESKTLADQVKALRDASTALQGELVDLIKLDHAYQSLLESPLADADLQAVLPDLAGEVEQAQA
ncbi:MAG: hypothetical protein JXQ72_08975, partial [Anaerolineae bacterium]|nr:hypothetical protein [Anaerolineae bacterium]